MLPSLTVCPWPAFKEKGFHYTAEKYEDMAFTKEDLFNKSAMKSAIRDFNYLDIQEIRSLALGRCFTIKVTKPLSLNEPFVLTFKRSWDVTVIIHSYGEEFWLTWLPYGPPFFNRLQLKIKNNTETVATAINLAEKQVQHISKSGRPCNSTTSGPTSEDIMTDAAHYRYNS